MMAALPMDLRVPQSIKYQSPIGAEYVLSIDLGASGCKCAVVSLQGEVIAWEFTAVETEFIGHDGVQQSPADWWTVFVLSATAVIAAAQRQSLKIAAVCASTQSEGTVAVGKDGTVLHPAIVWLDMRGAAAIQRRAGAGLFKVAGYNIRYSARWIRLTGGVPALSGKDQAAHTLFIRGQLPDIYQNDTRGCLRHWPGRPATGGRR